MEPSIHDQTSTWGMKLAYRPYKCTVCGHEEEIQTNHTGTVSNYCKGCSWKPSFGPGHKIPALGNHTYRVFKYNGQSHSRKESMCDLDIADELIESVLWESLPGCPKCGSPVHETKPDMFQCQNGQCKFGFSRWGAAPNASDPSRKQDWGALERTRHAAYNARIAAQIKADKKKR